VEREKTPDKKENAQLSVRKESGARVFELSHLEHHSAVHNIPDAVVRVPDNFDPSKPIHLVVYNHGFGSTAKSAYSINKLDQQLANAPPNTVLIVPEWQVEPGSRKSDLGNLQNPEAFRGMLQEAFDKTPGLKGKSLNDVQDVAILAHSAGYRPAEMEIKCGAIK